CASFPCANGGTCSDSCDLGSFHCTCAPGFAGGMCHIWEACASFPCANGGTCSDSCDLGSFHCTCAPGFAGGMC
ncbi:predicted protein, partial [Nematostella vectensis]